MQVVELADIILALLIELLVGVILSQPLKATSGEKMARPGFHGFVAVILPYRAYVFRSVGSNRKAEGYKC